jgi:hypothetical protein
MNNTHKTSPTAGTMSEGKREAILESLADWIIRTTNKKDLATPEEIAALPKVAEVYFEHYSSVFFSPVRRL